MPLYSVSFLRSSIKMQFCSWANGRIVCLFAILPCLSLVLHKSTTESNTLCSKPEKWPPLNSVKTKTWPHLALLLRFCFWVAVVLQVVVSRNVVDTLVDGGWEGILEGAVRNVLQRQPRYLLPHLSLLDPYCRQVRDLPLWHLKGTAGWKRWWHPGKLVTS